MEGGVGGIYATSAALGRFLSAVMSVRVMASFPGVTVLVKRAGGGFW